MELRKFEGITNVPANVSMGDLANSSRYAYVEGPIYGRPVLKRPIHFFSQLVRLERCERGPEACKLLRTFGDDYWIPADPWHHLAFAGQYPDVQDKEEPDPIVSVDGSFKVGKFNRVIATYWEAYDGRKLYLNFEDAYIGPRVWFLVVHEVVDA